MVPLCNHCVDAFHDTHEISEAQYLSLHIKQKLEASLHFANTQKKWLAKKKLTVSESMAKYSKVRVMYYLLNCKKILTHFFHILGIQ